MSEYSGRASASSNASRPASSSLFRPILNFRSNLSTFLSRAATEVPRTARTLWSKAPTDEQLSTAFKNTYNKVSRWYTKYNDVVDGMGMKEVTTAINDAIKGWIVNQEIDSATVDKWYPTQAVNHGIRLTTAGVGGYCALCFTTRVMPSLVISTLASLSPV